MVYSLSELVISMEDYLKYIYIAPYNKVTEGNAVKL